ncbi:MAG: CocE/NonD family hydrolase, partial [Anaerolineales bacterium]|nr:CocE/NonD family hydrolase [Anaerolineales bacterium]
MDNGILVCNQIAGVNVIKNVLIPMRDGVMLAADLYVPDNVINLESTDVSLSVVVEYTPYRKDEVTAGDTWYDRFPRHGYVMARVDVRGTGASGGVSKDEYMAQEQVDGYDVIEWLASQPWCNGHVNMIGLSYGGNTCLQVATLDPPHLTSIIPIYFTDDRYTDDCHYRGGLLRMYYDAGAYGNEMNVYNTMPPYPEWSGADWAQLWEERLEHNEPYILKWLEHQTNDAYWRHGSVQDCPERIQCPVFMIGGWRDGYPNPPFRLYQKLSVPKKLLIGPWNHSLPDVAVPGPRIDYLHEVLRWLDFWCKGEKTGIMDDPPVTVFVQRYNQPLPDRQTSLGEWRA